MVMELLALETLGKLVDKGIDLLREGERQKKLFFEEVVKPTQEVFDRMYQDHIATFAKSWTMLLDPEAESKNIAAFVKERILFEGDVPIMLRRLTSSETPDDWRRTPGKLKDHYAEYIASVRECLNSIEQEGSGYERVGYYAALSSLVSGLTDSNDREARGRALDDLSAITHRFQRYHVRVTERYLQLQRYCSA